MEVYAVCLHDGYYGYQLPEEIFTNRKRAEKYANKQSDEYQSYHVLEYKTK